MRGNNKKVSRGNTSNTRRITKLNFRDKISSQLRRLIKKEQFYVVEPSSEPEGNNKYKVVYESNTENGFGCGSVFKGTFKECHALAKKLNKVNNKEVKKNE